MKPKLRVVKNEPELSDLTNFKLVYLGTPYSKYPSGLDAAFREAARVAGALMSAGVRVYSPITHGHSLSVYGGVNPLSHETWLPFDEAMMDVSEAIVVARMESWQTSKGIAHEIDYFSRAGKPVFYLNPETLEVEQ